VVNRNNINSIIENEKATYLSYLTGAYLFFFYMEASLRWPAFEAIRFHFVFGLILTVLCSFKYLSSKQTKVIRNETKRKMIVVLYSMLFISFLLYWGFMLLLRWHERFQRTYTLTE
jgi:hypothetical protein